MKYVSPSISETAFNCPHCGVLTTQYWYFVYGEQTTKNALPFVVTPDDARDFSFGSVEDEKKRARLISLIERMRDPRPFLWKTDDTNYNKTFVRNCHVSQCYECHDLSFWIYDRLIFPVKGEAPPANPDLPVDILRDYHEASSILNLSPRGAAALIRLCIQKLCKHLDQPGENINADIAALVKAGLDSRIQKALDAVRVIGNNAVHPGSIDLRDDRATAESLFKLVNIIADKMISEPKHVDEVYASLPPNALSAIEKRDNNGT